MQKYAELIDTMEEMNLIQGALIFLAVLLSIVAVIHSIIQIRESMRARYLGAKVISESQDLQILIHNAGSKARDGKLSEQYVDWTAEQLLEKIQEKDPKITRYFAENLQNKTPNEKIKWLMYLKNLATRGNHIGAWHSFRRLL